MFLLCFLFSGVGGGWGVRTAVFFCFKSWHPSGRDSLVQETEQQGGTNFGGPRLNTTERSIFLVECTPNHATDLFFVVVFCLVY